ncbi:MAG: nucleotidyltransferase domain-containing protein [Pseudomonadota bacterium]
MTTPVDKLPDIAITPEQWMIVSAILQKHVPDKEVWAFGSRATHTAKPHSDLDLAIISDIGLSLSLLAAVEHDFSESDLPFKVDVVDWATITPVFRGIIQSCRIRVW